MVVPNGTLFFHTSCQSAMFSTEQELINAFKGISKLFLSDLLERSISRFFLVEEFNSQNGIADLVIGTYRAYLSRSTIRKTINLNWISPLTNFETGSIIDLAGFMTIYRVSRKTASKRLQEYAEAGFLQPLEQDKYKILKKYKLITDTVISIEAKLKNWQRALQQAHRYKRFSHNSYVLLDDSKSRPALKNIALFKKYNIGLMTMNHDGYIVHHVPTRQEAKKTHAYLRVNEVAYNYFKTQCASA